MAARSQDGGEVLKIFDAAAAPGEPPLNVSHYAIITAVLAGGESWESRVRARFGSGDFTPSRRGHEARIAEVFAGCRAESDRSRQAVPEVVYTNMARAAALRGDADEALRIAQEAAGRGAGPRLRTFHPALVGLALAGRWADALAVEGALKELQLEAGETVRARERDSFCTTSTINLYICSFILYLLVPPSQTEMPALSSFNSTPHPPTPFQRTPQEYQYLLEACTLGAAPEATVRALLLRLADDVVRLGPRTLELLERWFASEAARAPFAEGGRLAGKVGAA